MAVTVRKSLSEESYTVVTLTWTTVNQLLSPPDSFSPYLWKDSRDHSLILKP